MKNIMEKLIEEYYYLVKQNSKISLNKLFTVADCSMEDRCRSYQPHEQINSIMTSAKNFGEKYKILLKNDPYYIIAVASYTYPTAKPSRVLDISKIFMIGYYLNEHWGRDVFSHLSSEEQILAKQIVERMTVAENSFSESSLHGVERANMEILETMRNNTSNSSIEQKWFDSFCELWSYYIEITHTDDNSKSYTVEEYSKLRCHYSGGIYGIKLLEYSLGEYIDWDWLKLTGLDEMVKRSITAIENVCGLTNDFFSFEKEVIDMNAESNILMVVALNNPSFTLMDIINASTKLIRGFLEQYDTARTMITHKLSLMSNDSSGNVNIITRYLNGLDLQLQCIWGWQILAKRYKRKNSIWVETEYLEINNSMKAKVEKFKELKK